MDSSVSPAEDRIRFLLSLLKIGRPGEPDSAEMRELEELLAAQANR